MPTHCPASSWPRGTDSSAARIVSAQALRTAFPTLASSLIAMIKDTSLAANITVTEMFMTTQRIVARTYEPLALYIEVGLVYLLFCVSRYGWGWDNYKKEVNTGKGLKIHDWMRGYLTYGLPVIVLFIFAFGIYDKFFA